MSLAKILAWLVASLIMSACTSIVANSRSLDSSPPDPLDSRIEAYQSDEYIFDVRGIIQPVRGRKWSEPIYHPTVISRYAMGLYRHWLETGDGEAIREALIQTDYLVSQLQCEENGFAILQYDYPGSFGLSPGWHSAMGQGLAIAALSQLAPFSDRQIDYRAAMDCARAAFPKDVLDGGFLTIIDEDAWWYEEYPAVSRPKVLNGHIFSLVGLWYLAKDGDVDASDLLAKGANAVARYLPRYDAGYISRYAWTDKPNLLSPRRYNVVHIDQLLWLWHVTGNEIFREYANRFLAYQDGRLASFSVVNEDGVVSHARALDDSKTWYGKKGFRARQLPLTARAELPYEAKVYRIAIFSYGHINELPGVSFYQNESPLVVIPRPDLMTQHETGAHQTTVFVYDVPAAERGRHYSIRFSSPNANDGRALALREIDWHFDQSEPLLERYRELRTKNRWVGELRE
jgi:hypothetical protein